MRSGDKEEFEALKDKLNEETLTQITQLKTEILGEEDIEVDKEDDTEEVRMLRRELSRAREESLEYSQEVERLTKKITHKNSQLKTYKVNTLFYFLFFVFLVLTKKTVKGRELLGSPRGTYHTIKEQA